MDLSRLWPGYFLLLLFFSCGAKNEPVEEIMIAKTIPAVYIHAKDSLLSIHSDTNYYKGKFFSGYVYYLYENGDSTFINGKKQGPQRSWWPDGGPKMDYTAQNNEYQGEFREWNSTGLLIKKFHYKKGVETGRQQLWWDNGTVRANYEVRNGRTFGLIGLKLCVNPNDPIR